MKKYTDTHKTAATEYLIKTGRLTGTQKLIYRGKTVIKAPQILELAPSEHAYVRADNPIYVIKDKKGKLNVFNAKTQTYIATDVTPAPYTPREANGAPLLFNKGARSFYVTPKGDMFDVTGSQEICFAQNENGYATHDLAFVINGERPTLLYRSPAFDIVPGWLESKQLIFRTKKQDTIDNVYAPFLITNVEEMSEFCKAYPITRNNLARIKALAPQSVLQPTSKNYREVAECYLTNIFHHIEKVAQGPDRRYTSISIPHLITNNKVKIKRQNNEIASNQLQINSLQRIIDDTQADLEPLRKDYSHNFDTIELLDAVVNNRSREIRDLVKTIAHSRMLIENAKKDIQELTYRGECLEYTQKLDKMAGLYVRNAEPTTTQSLETETKLKTPSAGLETGTKAKTSTGNNKSTKTQTTADPEQK